MLDAERPKLKARTAENKPKTRDGIGEVVMPACRVVHYVLASAPCPPLQRGQLVNQLFIVQQFHITGAQAGQQFKIQSALGQFWSVPCEVVLNPDTVE